MATQTDDAIFDASSYDLPIPNDRYGRKADRLQLILGAFDIDRTDENALEVFNELERGNRFELRVSVFVLSASEDSKENEEGEMVTSIRRVLKVRGIEKA